MSKVFRPASSTLAPTDQIRQKRNHVSIMGMNCSPSPGCTPFSRTAKRSKSLDSVMTLLSTSIGTVSVHLCRILVDESIYFSSSFRILSRITLPPNFFLNPWLTLGLILGYQNGWMDGWKVVWNDELKSFHEPKKKKGSFWVQKGNFLRGGDKKMNGEILELFSRRKFF